MWATAGCNMDGCSVSCLSIAETLSLGSRHRAPRGAGRQARPAASRPGRLRRRGGKPPTAAGTPPPQPENQSNKAVTEAGGSAWSRGLASGCRASPRPGLACHRTISTGC